MAMVQETGFGTVGANAYGSVAGFRAYHTARGVSGVDSGSVSDSAVEALLIGATDYLEGTFGSLFRGREAYDVLPARVTVTFASLPVDGDTVTIGGVVYTFRDWPAAASDVAIAAEIPACLEALEASLGSVANTNIAGYTSDLASRVAVFTPAGGVAASASGARVVVDRATSSGASRRPQPLSWPRVGVYYRGAEVAGVPEGVENAVYEYAQRARSGALLPDPTVDASGRRVVESSEKVGPIETMLRLGEVVSLFSRSYPAADRLLEPYLGAGASEVIR